ncbi:hypothetical protein Bhyg_09557 [Pseudolycoriella hygida]|uniref:Uncharacterized protein n=1 Tax=Pseudolycoriella hygida TaxID=35572 RepID=A0A9Q0N6Q0_9DIPT|nr:hypothetical protein Bhyg_09557 [Pseudolycoriella hygida]
MNSSQGKSSKKTIDKIQYTFMEKLEMVLIEWLVNTVYERNSFACMVKVKSVRVCWERCAEMQLTSNVCSLSMKKKVNIYKQQQTFEQKSGDVKATLFNRLSRLAADTFRLPIAADWPSASRRSALDRLGFAPHPYSYRGTVRLYEPISKLFRKALTLQ